MHISPPFYIRNIAHIQPSGWNSYLLDFPSFHPFAPPPFSFSNKLFNRLLILPPSLLLTRVYPKPSRAPEYTLTQSLLNAYSSLKITTEREYHSPSDSVWHPELSIPYSGIWMPRVQQKRRYKWDILYVRGRATPSRCYNRYIHTCTNCRSQFQVEPVLCPIAVHTGE